MTADPDPLSLTRGADADAFAEDVCLAVYEAAMDETEPDLPWLLAAAAGLPGVPPEEVEVARATVARIVGPRMLSVGGEEQDEGGERGGDDGASEGGHDEREDAEEGHQ